MLLPDGDSSAADAITAGLSTETAWKVLPEPSELRLPLHKYLLWRRLGDALELMLEGKDMTGSLMNRIFPTLLIFPEHPGRISGETRQKSENIAGLFNPTD